MMSDQTNEKISQRLMSAFVQFRRIRPSDMDDFCQKEKRRLKHSEIMVLLSVKEIEGKYPDGGSISDLSGNMRVKSPTIVPAIYNLEREKLVERKTDQNDRRVIRVSLTEEGNRFIQTHMQRFIHHIRGLVAYLGEENSNTLADLLNEVYIYVNNRSDQKK